MRGIERRAVLGMMLALPFGVSACTQTPDRMRTVGLVDPTVKPELKLYLEEIAAAKSLSLRPYSPDALHMLDLIRQKVPDYLLASSAVTSPAKLAKSFQFRGVGLAAPHGMERIFLCLSHSEKNKEVDLYYGGIRKVMRLRLFVPGGDLRNPMTQRSVEVAELLGKTVDSWSTVLYSQLPDRTVDNFAKVVDAPSIPVLDYVFNLLDRKNSSLLVSERDTESLRDYYESLGKAA